MIPESSFIKNHCFGVYSGLKLEHTEKHYNTKFTALVIGVGITCQISQILILILKF